MDFKSIVFEFIDGKETKNPKPTVVFDTTDSLSGVDYYKIKIGEGDFSCNLFIHENYVKKLTNNL